MPVPNNSVRGMHRPIMAAFSIQMHIEDPRRSQFPYAFMPLI